MELSRLEQDRILAAKYIAAKWTEPLYEAVRNSTPQMQSVSEPNLRWIIGVCAGLNCYQRSLFVGSIGTHEWAQSVAESSIIMAYVSDYNAKDLFNNHDNDQYWVDTIIRARNGFYGNIPGTNMKVLTESVVVPVHKPIEPPKRSITTRKEVKVYVPQKPKTYLMRDDNHGYTKIGKSIRPRVRERTLLADAPIITLFAVCEQNIERELHAKYSDKNIRGEWYNLTDEDIDYICRTYNFNKYEDEYPK